MKLNGTHQFLVYAGDDNILAGSIHTIRKNTEALIVACKEISPEVNADNTTYMVKSRDQNAGRNHNIKIENSSFEMVEEFKYLGTNLTNKNSMQEEMKSKFKSANAIIRCRIYCLPA